VKGGCCKKCGSKKHPFQYYPERQKKKDEVSDEDSAGDVQVEYFIDFCGFYAVIVLQCIAMYHARGMCCCSDLI
jgi:hypothetical protein